MPKRYFAAHDLGTSSVKATLVEAQEGVVRSLTCSYPLVTDASGKAEQNAADWWNAFCQANRSLLDGIDPVDVEAVSLSGQMMVCLPVRGDEPLCPAMIWADGRARKEADELEKAFPPGEFYRRVGMRPSPNHSLPKWKRFRQLCPELYEKTDCFLSAKDFINLKLTGRYATDPEDAAFMHALELNGADWSEALLAAAGIDRSKMPELLPVGTILGGVLPEAARECGLRIGTPVVLGTGDGGAATLGSGTFQRGDAYISLGTSSWVCAITHQPTLDEQMRIAKIRYLDGFRDSGTMQAGGFSFSWLKSLLNRSYDEMAEMALSVQPGSDGVLFLPNLMGERAPFWDIQLKGSFVGMSASTGAAQLCRAVPEGVAMQLELIFKMILETNRPLNVQKIRLVGGGADSLMWRSILADVFGLPIVTTDAAGHAGALGIAVIAGKAVGVFDGYEAVLNFHHHEKITRPSDKHAARYQELKKIFLSARQALVPVDHQISRQLV